MCPMYQLLSAWWMSGGGDPSVDLSLPLLAATAHADTGRESHSANRAPVLQLFVF